MIQRFWDTLAKRTSSAIWEPTLGKAVSRRSILNTSHAKDLIFEEAQIFQLEDLRGDDVTPKNCAL
jgi:hypothetical protein